MKRKPFFCFLIFALSAILFLCLFACAGKKTKDIPVPKNLSVENNVLTWDAVTGALSYDIMVDDSVYTSDENKYTLPISDYAEHELCVRANTYDGTGNYSEKYFYKRTRKESGLQTLSAPRISMTGNRVMWNTILNNNGYKIYFDGKTYLTEKNATYYELTFEKDGLFEITMQTIGDGVSYATSPVSSPYLVQVTNGKAPLQSLPKVEFSFNAETKSLEWVNRYSAAAVSYEIYREDGTDPVAVIPADATKTKLSYPLNPLTPGGRVTYKMRLVSNNGLYASSNMNEGITLPIADDAPASLSVNPDVELGEYRFTWEARTYLDGYVLEIDGVSYPATDHSLSVPDTLSAGRHIARVKTMGTGEYFRDSLFSGGIVFYTKDGGKMTTALESPTVLDMTLTAERITVRIAEVENASEYVLYFRGADDVNALTTTESDLEITKTTVGSRAATEEEKILLAKIFAEAENGVTLSAAALPTSELFVASPKSEERETLSLSGTIEKVAAPDGFHYDLKGFDWVPETGTNVLYELLLDGEIKEVRAGDTVPITEGEHVARIRKKAEHALWSQEIFFRVPYDLAAPTDLKVTSGILTFTGSDGASGYFLYANGEKIATVYSSETMILLSSYLETDGVYTLSVAAAASGAINDSPLSEECLYVKTDGAYGTEAKPFVPQSSTELLSLMKENPGAYFELVAAGTYDFSNVDFDTQEAFVFSGVILGNGATIKGMKLHFPLFSSLNRATVRNVKWEIDASAFASSRGGILASSADSALLSDVRFIITGTVNFARSATFGGLFYSARDLAIRNVTLTCDLTLNCGENCDFGALAYDLSGTITGLTLGGSVSIKGNAASCSGLASTGTMTVNGFVNSLTVPVKGLSSAVAAGYTKSGTASAKNSENIWTVSLDAPIIAYYGGSEYDATVSDSTFGGSVVTTMGKNVSIYGISRDVSSLKNVTVSSSLKGSATEELNMAGISFSIGEAETSDLLFEGRLEATASDDAVVKLAGCAFETTGEKEFCMKGDILLSGGQASVTAGVFSAEDLTLLSDAKISVDSALSARIGGGVSTATGKVVVSGGLEINATNCGDVFFGGVAEKGDQHLDVNGYELSGSIASNVLRAGGVSYEGYNVTLDRLDLSVDLSVSAQSLAVSGGLIGANSLAFSTSPNLSTKISGVGNGRIAGFGMGISSVSLDGVSLTGSLSLVGTGSLFGVAEEVNRAENISSSVSLSGEGEVVLYGLFERVLSAKTLLYQNAEVNILSDHGAFYGVSENISSGVLEDASLVGVTLCAEPLSSSESSDLMICGFSDRLNRVKGVTVSNTVYEVGAYDELTFGGVAYSFAESAEDGAVTFRLTSKAKASYVGGAFVEGRGRINAFRMGSDTPLTVVTQGGGDIGGMIQIPGTVTVTRGSTYLSLDMTLSASDEARAGGLTSVVSSHDSLTLSDHPINVKMVRRGGGSALLGGVTGECQGNITGAAAETDVNDVVLSDTIGGIVGKSVGGSLQNVLAKGKITALSSVGGIVGECVGTSVDGAAAALTISGPNRIGGLFARAENALILNAYSLCRLTEGGYGLFHEGVGLSMTFCYFAGEAHTASLAGNAESCSVDSIFVDASLNDLPLCESGSLSAEYRTFGYGYTGADLGNAYQADGERYPYIAAIGYPLRRASVTTQELSSVNLKGTVNLYAVLPRLADASAPNVTWVDQGGNLEIENGVATVVDSRSGVLLGMLSEGVVAYRVPYTVSDFVPFAGEGTEENPYLISDLKYLHHLPGYASEHPSAYFAFAIEGGRVENVVLNTLFTASAPFDGTIDFAGVRFLSPVIGEDGLLGYLSGATVKNLVLENASISGAILARSASNSVIRNATISATLSGEGCFVSSLTDCSVTDVTFVADTPSSTTFALFESVTGGEIKDVSMRVATHCGEDVALSFICLAESADVKNVQVLFHAVTAGAFDACLVRTDDHSAFSSVMVMTDASGAYRAESEIAGFVLSADGSTFASSVAVTTGGDGIYPLIKQGTASYDAVVLCSDAVVDGTPGVTSVSPIGLAVALSEIPGFEEGVLFTPLGFDFLADPDPEDPDYGFEASEESLYITENASLSSLMTLWGEQPLSTMVSYAFTGDGAVISDGYLCPTGSGEGTLTLTNVYGESVLIDVTITYDAFAAGDGTEEDPYLIESLDDFIRMDSYRDGSYFRVTQNISGTLSESLRLNGVLLGGDHTITIDLDADVLFEEGSGSIFGANFVLRKDSATFLGDGALFMKEAENVTLENVQIRIECPVVTLSEEGSFALVFGQISDGVLKDVSVGFADVEIAVEEGRVGIVAATAESTIVKNLVVEGNLSVTSSGGATVGAFGKMTASESSYRQADELDPEEFVSLPYVDGLSLTLFLSVSGGDLVVGGAAGESNVDIKGIVGTVQMELSGDLVTAGGIVGILEAQLTSSSLDGSINAEGEEVSVGGAVGEANGTISDGDFSVTLVVLARGVVKAGGVVAYGSGDLENIRVQANVTASSEGEEECVSDLLTSGEEHPVLASAGGVAADCFGNVSGVSVVVAKVSAATAYASSNVFVLAGGIGAVLKRAEDVEVKGSGLINASGASSAAAGGAAFLKKELSRAVISGVTLSADRKAGACAFAAYNGDGLVEDVFVALDGTGLFLVYDLLSGTDLIGGKYLAGETTNTFDDATCRILNCEQLSELEAFYNAALYGAFNDDIWLIGGDALPGLL